LLGGIENIDVALVARGDNSNAFSWKLATGIFDTSNEQQQQTVFQQACYEARHLMKRQVHASIQTINHVISGDGDFIKLRAFIISLGRYGMEMLFSACRNLAINALQLTQYNYLLLANRFLSNIGIISSSSYDRLERERIGVKTKQVHNQTYQGPTMSCEDFDDFDGHDLFGGQNNMNVEFISNNKLEDAIYHYPCLTQYIDTAQNRITCVEEIVIGNTLMRTFALPKYDANGNVTNEVPVIVDVGICGNKRIDINRECPCQKNSEAKLQYLNDIKGRENNMCYHQWFLECDKLFQRLCNKPFISSKAWFCDEMGNEGKMKPYVIMIESNKNEQKCFVYCQTYDNNITRKDAALCTVTCKSIKCWVCHTKKRINKTDNRKAKDYCAHCKLVQLCLQSDCVKDDFKYLKQIYYHHESNLLPSCRFDTATQRWICPSESFKIEDEILFTHNIKPINVQRRLLELKGKCRFTPSIVVPGAEGNHNDTLLDGDTHIRNCFETNKVFFTPKDFCVQTPLFNDQGCVYGDEDYSVETKNCKVYYLTFVICGEVRTRECSCRHPECRIRWSGRTDNLHRVSATTAVAHEVLLLYWHLVPIMHGSGAEAYVKLVQALYSIAEHNEDVAQAEVNHDCVQFLKGDTVRKAFYGYVARLRINFSHPCPSRMCPIVNVNGDLHSQCKNLIWDGKMMALTKANPVTPEVPTDNSPQVTACFKTVAERLFIKGKMQKPLRMAIRQLSQHILEINQSTKTKDLSEEQYSLVSSLPPEYNGFSDVVKIMITKYDEISSHRSLYGDGDNDNDDKDDVKQQLEDDERDIEDNVHSGPCGDDVNTLYPKGAPDVVDGAALLRSTLTKRVKHNHRLRRNIPGCDELTYEIANLMNEINRESTEATQWITRRELPHLKHILSLSYYNFYDLLKLQNIVRTSTLRLITKGGIDCKNNQSELRPAISSLLSSMILCVEGILQIGDNGPSRVIIPPEEREPNDPSKGYFINFTEKCQKIAELPTFKNLNNAITETDGECNKPSWVHSGARGSRGLFTVLCAECGDVKGFTIITTGEGCKHGFSVLSCYHPDPKSIDTLISDTACKHAAYFNTRLPRDFAGIKHTLDEFHSSPHVCGQCFHPEQYQTCDNKNTSFIEQYHARVDVLERMFYSSTIEHAMLILMLFNDDHYHNICDNLHLPMEHRSWPTDPLPSIPPSSFPTSTPIQLQPPLTSSLSTSSSTQPPLPCSLSSSSNSSSIQPPLPSSLSSSSTASTQPPLPSSLSSSSSSSSTQPPLPSSLSSSSSSSSTQPPLPSSLSSSSTASSTQPPLPSSLSSSLTSSSTQPPLPSSIRPFDILSKVKSIIEDIQRSLHLKDYDDCYIKIENAIVVIDNLKQSQTARRTHLLDKCKSQVLDFRNEVDDAIAENLPECPELRQLRTALTDVEESYIADIIMKPPQSVVVKMPFGAAGGTIDLLVEHLRR
jgi:hypothetical protein